MNAATWLARLDGLDGGTMAALQRIYGGSFEVMPARVQLLRSVVRRFESRFGDGPVRVFRSPGRINLRGMHVDTHGGYLNLMTHQREAVVAAAPEPGDVVTLSNLDERYGEVSFRIREEAAHPGFQGDWMDFIQDPEVRSEIQISREGWGNYVKGCFLNLQHRLKSHSLRGIRGVVGSDVPRGAALSSSSALSVAVLQAALGCNGLDLSKDAQILAVKDAEWYAGSRIGVSDQAAMILGGRGELVSVALHAARLDVASARRTSFPPELAVLVINSHTTRNLSGEHLVEYARNRFAYSLALPIVRHELRAMGLPEEVVGTVDHLPALSPAALEEYGGEALLYQLLLRIPVIVDLSDLALHYNIPKLDEIYLQYFGAVAEAMRPREICLRGPLLFGIAESERARVFPPALAQGDFEEAGRLMTVGHNGDRVRDAAGMRYAYDVSDAAVERLAQQHAPIRYCPGVYSASSPILDALVDTALGAGALGASLTGAGIAGAVLALCRDSEADRIAEAVRERLCGGDYAALAKRPSRLTDEQVADAVICNHATAGAGEIVL